MRSHAVNQLQYPFPADTWQDSFWPNNADACERRGDYPAIPPGRETLPPALSNQHGQCAAGNGKLKTAAQTTYLLGLTLLLAAFAVTVQAKDPLEIDKAVIGSKDTWQDITQLLRDQIENDAVSFQIAQPFTEIGGDPSPGRVKNLIVDYHLNGRPYRLWLEEQFPVAFNIKLPSPDAEMPGANPQAAAMVDNMAARSTSRPGLQSGKILALATLCIALSALVFSVVALAQVRKLRRHRATPGGVPPLLPKA